MEAVYKIRRETFTPYYKVITSSSKYYAPIKYFLAKDVTISAVPDSPKYSYKDERPESFIQASRWRSTPDVLIRHSLQVFHPNRRPYELALCTSKEDMQPVLHTPRAPLTFVILHHVFSEEVDLGADPIFKIKPCKNLNLVW
jgi:hypothetical protein